MNLRKKKKRKTNLNAKMSLRKMNQKIKINVNAEMKKKLQNNINKTIGSINLDSIVLFTMNFLGNFIYSFT